MILFILALVVAAIVCGIAWRRPDARAAVSGAWQAGKAQAVREFRDGYTFAQQQLRAGDPRWYSPRRWASWGLSTGYGAAKTLAAANRIRRAAWRGGKDGYRAWKDAQPVDAQEVVEQVIVGPDKAEFGDPPVKGWTECPRCGARITGIIPGDEQDVWVTCPCGHKVCFYRAPNDPPDDWDKDPEPPDSSSSKEPEPHHPPQEGTDVQTEATGLTSYAHAHQQFASELRAQMSGSESLAASMATILNEHSDLIGDTAVLQDLLNQAAGVADRIAERATTVANN
ncbi:hypothetical protein [Nonomuraea sp. NPDC049400]|uniref:hypothetical protein n=1 Tax=Nonomuraea sp. NPDC049400 TaxID=3364352 RepID=UPI0037A0ACA6